MRNFIYAILAAISLIALWFFMAPSAPRTPVPAFVATPESVTSDEPSTAVDAADCVYLFNNLFQQVGQATVDSAFDATDDFFARADSNICEYHQTVGLAAAPAAGTGATNGFTYNPENGNVLSFLNKPN